MLPVFVIPARRIGTRLQEITRESLQPQRLDERDDDRAVQRRRRAAGQAVRPARRRGRVVPRPGRAGCATSASRRRCTAGRSSSRSPWSPRWPRRWSTAWAATTRSPAQLSAGTVVTLALLLTRLYGPLTALSNARVDVMSALVSFDRVFEVLDLDADDRRRARTPSSCRPTPRSIEFDDVRFSYPTADEVSLASLEDVAVLDTTRRPGGAARRLASAPSRASWSRWSGRPARARRRSASCVPRIYDVTVGRGAGRRARRPRR